MQQVENKTQKLSILKGVKYFIGPKLLHRLFEKKFIKNSSNDETALIYEDEGVPRRQTKYLELNQIANQIANTILDLVKESASEANQDGDWIIAICMKPSDNLVTTMLAIWKSGAAYLPIDVAFPQNRIEHILNDAKPVLVIHDDSYPNSSYFATAKSIKFGNLKSASSRMSTENISEENTLTIDDANRKAIILFTSGSTGMPKGVRLRHSTVNHRIQWQLKVLPFSDTEKHCVFKTAFTFVDHMGEIWCPLFDNRVLIIVPKDVLTNPAQFVTILEDYKIERLLGVPTLLRCVLMYMDTMENNKDKLMLSNLRMWISSGENLTVQLAREFFDYFDKGRQVLVNFYGCTELDSDACTFVLQSRQQLESLQKIPIGTPVHNSIVYVLDKDMTPVNEGETGEIYCAGVIVTDGYINGGEHDAFMRNPMESSEHFCNMYRTGDFGMIKDGLLYFEGRRDSQIKIRGHRVDITEVEKNINELNYVDKSVVLVYHAQQLDQALVAFVSNKKSDPKSPAEVEKDLKTRLTYYMIPHVMIIEKFPFLPNGKVDRQILLKMYENITVKGQKQVEQGMDFKNVPKEKMTMAKQVFEIVANSIGNELRDKLSLDANFFDLGGNSMNSIYTVAQLRKKGYFVPLTDFLHAENLGVLLNKVTTEKDQKVGNDIEIKTGMKLVFEPLSYAQQEECIQLLATSFINKSGIEQSIPDLKVEHYVDVFRSIWDLLIEKGLSFLGKNDKGELVAVSLNFDAMDNPCPTPPKPLDVIFNFCHSIEAPFFHIMNAPVGEVFNSLMMGTSHLLSPMENVDVMAAMEEEVIKLARAKGFKSIFTNNTNPLTQQFGESVFGYQTLKEFVIQDYVDKDGNRPFALASKSVKSVIMYKSLV